MSDAGRVIIESSSVEDTQRIGRELGRALAVGDVLALIGQLGAGKTALVQGIAAGAGVADRRQVNSPTFVIVNEYDAGEPGRELRLFHIDAYRLRGADDLAALGFDEMPERGAVLVEWADRVREVLPPTALIVTIEATGPTQRRLTCETAGVRPELVTAIQAAGGIVETPRTS